MSETSLLISWVVKDAINLEVPIQVHVSLAPFEHLVVGEYLLLEFSFPYFHLETEQLVFAIYCPSASRRNVVDLGPGLFPFFIRIIDECSS
jgi:hypothetical protein